MNHFFADETRIMPQYQDYKHIKETMDGDKGPNY